VTTSSAEPGHRGKISRQPVVRGPLLRASRAAPSATPTRISASQVDRRVKRLLVCRLPSIGPKAAPHQPWARAWRTGWAGHGSRPSFAFTFMPSAWLTSACEQSTCSTATTSSLVVGNQPSVAATSAGQMRHVEPSESSTTSLVSWRLIESACLIGTIASLDIRFCDDVDSGRHVVCRTRRGDGIGQYAVALILL
jgi:hypothetical protein